MKIAIASEGKDMKSEVSKAAARAPYFIVFDEGRLREVISNPFAVGGGGAGWSVAKMLEDKGIDLMVAGKFGGNMVQALGQRNMRSHESSGTVEKALKSIEDK